MVTIDEVKHLAGLSRLSVSDDTLPALAKELDSIFAYVGKLDELTVSGSDTPKVPLLRNVFREDSNPTSTGTYTKKIVEAFPQHKGNALSVKQILKSPNK